MGWGGCSISVYVVFFVCFTLLCDFFFFLLLMLTTCMRVCVFLFHAAVTCFLFTPPPPPQWHIIFFLTTLDSCFPSSLRSRVCIVFYRIFCVSYVCLHSRATFSYTIFTYSAYNNTKTRSQKLMSRLWNCRFLCVRTLFVKKKREFCHTHTHFFRSLFLSHVFLYIFWQRECLKKMKSIP